MTSTSIGHVETINESVIGISELPGIFCGELVLIDGTIPAQIIHSDEIKATAVLLSKDKAHIGSTVTRTNRAPSICCPEKLLGKSTMISDLLKEGASAKDDAELLLVEKRPPELSSRAEIKDRVQTGVAVVDLLLPIGKGQRELVLGDRKTGKTTFLLQCANTQIEAGTIVIYCGIGKKSTELSTISHFFTTHPKSKNTIVLMSPAADALGCLALAPFVALTTAEYFASQGKDTLVILDDLTTHAKFYQEMALLAKHFPGRDSYPGNIFYLHAKLLERAGRFSYNDKGDTSSITCLPVAETTDSELTSFIVSNLISITDGHLLFDTGLFSKRHRPAIHTSLSITRVGKQTQTPLGRELTHHLTRFISRYEKTKNLAHFGAELGEETKKLLRDGDLLMASFIQERGVTYSIESQMVMTALLLSGFFDAVSPEKALAFQKTIHTKAMTDTSLASLLTTLVQSPTYDALLAAIESKKTHLNALL